MKKSIISPLVFAGILFSFINSQAAEDYAPNSEKEIKASSEVKMGWSKSAKIGVNFSLTSNNENVVGQTEGDSKTLGINADGGFNYKSKSHESRTTISLKEATSTAPPINRAVKSSDELKLTSIYLYTLENNPWLGPYARVQADTSIFKAEHVQKITGQNSNPDTYSCTGTNCTGEKAPPTDIHELQLSKGFEPLNTRESVGMFAKALDKKDHQLMFRLGFGAIQNKAKGVRVIADDEKTEGVIEYKILGDSSQSGVEFGFDWKYLLDDKTSLTATLDTLTPSGSIKKGDLCEKDKCSGTDLTDIAFNFKLATKVYDFVSLSVDYNFKRQPKTIRGDQKQILTLVNFTYTLL